VLVALLLSTAAIAETDAAATNLRVADRHIIPAYTALAESIGELDRSAAAFCENPDAEGLAKLREGFHLSMDAWRAIQHIRFGPVEFLLRYNRFELWPDKRGSVTKHLARLLASADPAALEPERFAAGSVAVQGFGALERLLFGEGVGPESFGPDAAGAYRCAAARAITSNLSEMSRGLVRDWIEPGEGHRRYFATATEGNAFYGSDREVASRLLNNLNTRLEVVADQKLGLPLGETIEKARGSRAKSWRSARSLRNIRMNLTGLHSLYREGFAPRLADLELDRAIETAFQDALQALDAIRGPLYDAVAVPERWGQVDRLRAATGVVKGLVSGALAQALDLSLGFNSLDGD